MALNSDEHSPIQTVTRNSLRTYLPTPVPKAIKLSIVDRHASASPFRVILLHYSRQQRIRG
jgi:hypothetical protein